MGIPTVVVTREGFSRVVANSFAGVGLPAEASQAIYPVNMFVPGSDLAPIEGKMDELIAGLTKWEPKIEAKRVATPPKVRVEFKEHEEAVASVNRLFLRNMWSDGLPIMPPTEKLVSWLLTGSDLSPDKVVIKILPRGGIATVKTVAINLGMAGGRPEYMPVLIAALEAIGKPQFRHELMNSTTCAVYPAVMINGPIAKQIRLGSGYGCLGPDPLHPAGASIGRAIRLLLQDAGGAIPGTGTMSIYGGPARYTNIVFAEDDDGLPSNWQTLSVEQGFPAGSNTVTAYAVSSTTNVPGGEVGNKDSALASLNRAAATMAAPNGNYWIYPYNPEGAAGILLMASGTAEGLSRLGWSKEAVKAYLWENSKIPASKLGPQVSAWWIPRERIMQDPMPISTSPKGVKIVVAGGLQSGHMMWLQVGCCPEQLTSAGIKLPAWSG
ncbi:MAG: hypothetical protein HYY80_03020 [Chloroflexi bacterium]|nr:hypothetical protein [Chloroflexota bacterium]